MPTPADIANLTTIANPPGTSTEPGQEAQATPSPSPAGLTPTPGENEADSGAQEDSFPRSYVEGLRRENANYRTRADQAATEAAEQARAELAQQIGQALGLVENEETDVQQLLEQATRDRDSTTASLREQAAENTVLRRAGADGLTLDDADRLLDSRRFRAALDDLDTNAPDFADQVSALITAHHTPRSAPAAPPAASHQHTGSQSTTADTSVSGFRSRFFGSK
ncbi:MAG: hypothetical protein ACTH31_15935 [Pseudoclavibacter sp.]